MQAAAGRMRKRFGHGRIHHAVLRSHRLRRHFEQHVTVGGFEHLIKAIVHLPLAVGVLVVDLQQLKIQRFELRAQALQPFALLVHHCKIIRRLGLSVPVIRSLQTFIASLFEDKKFRLNAYPCCHSLLLQLLQHGCQHLA